jgi:hypothetical protein
MEEMADDYNDKSGVTFKMHTECSCLGVPAIKYQS